MKVKVDLDALTGDLLDLDVVELSIVQDALAAYLEALYPEVAEALNEGKSIDDAVEGLDEDDAFRVHVIVERLYEKLERPLSILEEEADLRPGEGEEERVRIILEGEEEASLLHEAAKALSEQVGRALDASELPYPDAMVLMREFASWFDPDDIPEYPYYIEMEVADARIVAQLAEKVYSHSPSVPMEQLLRVMMAAATVTLEDEEGEE